MKISRIIMALVLSVLLMGLITGLATANVPGVALNAPPPPPAPNVATAGSGVTIKVVTTHRDTGSPALHYVDRVALYDGDKLLKEWKYDQNSFKKDETWTETYSGTANADMHLRAVAHCTVHGYELTGVHVRVLPAGTKPSDMMKTDASAAGMQAYGYPSASKAGDYMSSADSTFLGGLVKSQSNDLKSFQNKLSAWMKSSDGQQFIAQKDQQMASKPAARTMRVSGRKPSPTAKANVSAMPNVTVRRSLNTYAALRPADTRAQKVSPIPTPTPIIQGDRFGGIKMLKATPTAMASPRVKHMQARPLATKKPAPKVTASPAPKVTASPRPKTPAQSYGILGVGPVPSPKATVTARPAPSGVPTPVPGSFAPRFPGEPGAGKVPSPSPTVMPKVSPSPMPSVKPAGNIGGSAGVAGTPLMSQGRYSARGPGIVDGSMVMPPSSAPGPMASPSARPIRR